MKAFLLAAGYATRMYPLTRERAKPLLEVGGAAILDHLLDRILPLPGLSEVIVIANDRFAKDFEAWALVRSAPVPVRVLNDSSTCEADKRGAIGDLAFALERVPVGAEEWLVAAGDNLLGFDLAPLARVFREHAGATLLAVREVPCEGPSPYNEVTLDPTGRVLRFREKPRDPRSGLAAIALYFLPAAVAVRVPEYLDAGGNPDAPGHFVAWLVERCEVRAVPIAGPWFDIGSLAGLAQARAHFVPIGAAHPDSPGGPR